MDGPLTIFKRSQSRKTLGSIASLLFFGAAISGCGSHSTLPYPTYFPASDADSQPAERSNAFTDYLAASSDFSENLGARQILLIKSNYTPAEEKFISKSAGRPLRKIKEGLRSGCQIPYAPEGSKAANEGRPALRLLSKVLIRRIQDACEAQSFDDAIESTVLASKFGFDLCSGLPYDASLGLVTVDEARKALAPSLGSMSAKQLALLAKSMKTVYLNRPSMEPCFEDAAKDSLDMVQRIQDAYRSEDYSGLSKELGTASKEILPTLKELHQESDSRRAAFFAGFAQQAKDESEQVEKEAKMSVAQRVADEAGVVPPTGDRPWKRIARRVLGSGRPLLAMSDATDARTELLILEAEIMLSQKINGKTPQDLSRFSPKISTDPYSGQTFIYRTDGSDYKLYSVGDDLVDNDGETDETFSTPDLTLETASE
jgi:hypothetical protein